MNLFKKDKDIIDIIYTKRVSDAEYKDKFVYRRTDKAVGLDVEDHFLNHIDYERGSLSYLEYTNLRRKYELPYYRWTKAFLYARLHEMDHAVETMQDYYEWRNGSIPQKVMEKLEAVNELT